MSILVPFNGSNFIIPTPNEIGWGTNLDNYLVAIANGCLQNIGGTFVLSNDADFGGTNGIKSVYYKTRSTNTAGSGQFRLANAVDSINWRNFLNNADLPLTVNASDQLTFNGIPLSMGGSGTVFSGTQYQLAYYTTSTNAVSGLTLITPFKALISDINGLPTASIVTTTELGYISGVTSAIQSQLNSRALSGAVISSGLTESTNTLLGRSTAGTGAIEEISIGTGLSLSGGILSATGTGANTSLSNLSSVAINTPLLEITGLINAPSYSFTGHTGVGMWLDTTFGNLGFALGPSSAFVGDGTDVTLIANTTNFSGGGPRITLDGTAQNLIVVGGNASDQLLARFLKKGTSENLYIGKNSTHFYLETDSTNITIRPAALADTTPAALFDASVVSGDTRLKVWNVDASALQAVATIPVGVAQGGTGLTHKIFTSGTYTGNATNRNIAHGLGIIPSYIMIIQTNNGTQAPEVWVSDFPNQSGGSRETNGNFNTTAITGADATNINIGTSSVVNGNTLPYQWLAWADQ